MKQSPHPLGLLHPSLRLHSTQREGARNDIKEQIHL
jgi:hypothetical protein